MSGEGMTGPGPDERPHPEGRRNLEGHRIDPVVEAEHDVRRAVISALVEDEPGVLARVSGLVSRRQFNIESLTVGPTTVDGHSRITMVVEETDPGIDQIEKQMAKLKPVISVGEVSPPSWSYSRSLETSLTKSTRWPRCMTDRRSTPVRRRSPSS